MKPNCSSSDHKNIFCNASNDIIVLHDSQLQKVGQLETFQKRKWA